MHISKNTGVRIILHQPEMEKNIFGIVSNYSDERMELKLSKNLKNEETLIVRPSGNGSFADLASHSSVLIDGFIIDVNHHEQYVLSGTITVD